MPSSRWLTALAEVVGLAELPPEPLLPQAARLVPMAAAAAAIMMRRMETVLPAGGALIAPADRRRESLSCSAAFTQAAGPGSAPANRR